MTAADEESQVLAGEQALGLLDGPERAAAERRMLADRDFARAVEDWRFRLAAFADDAPASPAPEGLWARIARHLGEASQDVVVAKLKRGLVLWRGVSAAAACLVAALTVAVFRPPTTAPPPPPMMTARLAPSPQASAMFVALYDPGRRAIVLTPASIHAVPGRSPELWLIPVGGKPVPLGVATFGSSVQMISTAAAPMGTGTLAVSIEPQGGSPTGQPTGPVVATGQLTSL